jgi:hypothetical protein
MRFIRPASALLALLFAPGLACAQQLSADAQSFVVFQPARIVTFAQYPPGPGFYLHYSHQAKGGVGQKGPWYAIVVQVTRAASNEDALRQCNEAFNAPGGANLKYRKRLGGYACAFVQE